MPAPQERSLWNGCSWDQRAPQIQGQGPDAITKPSSPRAGPCAPGCPAPALGAGPRSQTREAQPTHVVLPEAALPVAVGVDHHLCRLRLADGHQPRLHSREPLQKHPRVSGMCRGGSNLLRALPSVLQRPARPPSPSSDHPTAWGCHRRG